MTGHKILIVDDEPHILRLLHGALTRAGYAVPEAASARQAMAQLEALDPDVVLLDLGLPDRDGMELVPLIKSRSSATLLIISAREATDEKVSALDLGADDYLTKPFDTDELLARVRATLRHRLNAQGAQATVVVGDVAIDMVRRRVTKAGEEVHLTPKEYDVVTALARFPRRVVTHDQLLRTVWANDYERHIEYLRVVIRNIRQKLENDPARPAIVVNELGDADQSGGGADFAEDFAVGGGDLLPQLQAGGVDARADDVADVATQGVQGRHDDVQGTAGLLGDRRGVLAIGPHADRAGDGDRVARPDCAAVADDRLPLRAGADTGASEAFLRAGLDVAGHGMSHCNKEGRAA